MTWHYIRTEPMLWTVCYGEPGTPDYTTESDHSSPEEAAERCAYLNGSRCDAPRIAELKARIRELEAALAPFAHPDLRKVTSGMVQGDESPVWGKEKALLTLGDFRRARAALEGSRDE